MDPNIVRQQEQAEREALRSILGSRGAKSANATGGRGSAGGVEPRTFSSVIALLGRLVSFPLAAASIASDLGFAVSQFLRWQAGIAGLALSETADWFSTLWGFAYLDATPRFGRA